MRGMSIWCRVLNCSPQRHGSRARYSAYRGADCWQFQIGGGPCVKCRVATDTRNERRGGRTSAVSATARSNRAKSTTTTTGCGTEKRRITRSARTARLCGRSATATPDTTNALRLRACMTRWRGSAIRYCSCGSSRSSGGAGRPCRSGWRRGLILPTPI